MSGTPVELILLLGGFLVGGIAGGAVVALRMMRPSFPQPDTCPNCGSDQNEGDDIEMMIQTDDGWIATQQCFCRDCGADWTDVYQLVEQRQHRATH